jgi:AbrB family looped-hinge helix DNA binding protein
MEIKATTRGRIVVPAAVRRQLNIKPGTRIHVAMDGANHSLVLTPITREYINSLRGSLIGGGAIKLLEADRRKELG